MWRRAATVERCLVCRTPFSFFFDLIQSHWRTVSPPPDKLTLHRLCTLARKQGAKFVVIESALDRDDVREDIDALDSFHGGGGEAEALTIAFFAGKQNPRYIHKVADDALLGVAILINYKRPGSADWTSTYIYEAIFAPPHTREKNGKKRNLLNNYICRDADFVRIVRNRKFKITGFYYCQQNAQTHVCAHACLRMSINTIEANKAPLTASAINTQLGLTPPAGMVIDQIIEIIRTTTGFEPKVVNCAPLQKKDVISIVSSYVESGCVVLLTFTTGTPQVDHVVTVFGHTRNTDEWHPQALPGYSGAPGAEFYQSSSWIDHFIISDDNLGPYYTLSSRALEVDPNVSASQIICLHPHKAEVTPHVAESVGAIFLDAVLGTIQLANTNRWLEYMGRQRRHFVMRAILINRDHYYEHMKAAVAHDNSKLNTDDLDKLSSLPDWFWMVEFSVPALFTGNRSKLGEVLLRTDNTGVTRRVDYILAMRLPGLFVLPTAGQPGSFSISASAMAAHSPIYLVRPHDNQW